MKIPIEYSVTDAKIAEIKEYCSQLTIDGLDDNKGYSVVRKARIRVKNLRIEVEHKRKELKADALKFGQAVDAEARRIKEELEPIENHLSQMEKEWEEEKERVRIRQLRLEELPYRRNRLDPYPGNENISDEDILGMDDNEFNQLVADMERLRLEQEAEKQRLEQERIDAENRRIQAEREALQREKELQERIAKEREDAARRAKEEAEAQLARVKAEAEAERINAEKERKRQEDLLLRLEQEKKEKDEWIRQEKEKAKEAAKRRNEENSKPVEAEQPVMSPGDMTEALFGGGYKAVICPHCGKDINIK